MLLERSFIAIEQGNFRIPCVIEGGAKRPKLGILVFILGILEFLTRNSSFLGVRGFLLSKI